MKQLYFSDRDRWRQWLSRYHSQEAGIWLVFYKKHTAKASIPYEMAVEEALCFGWIDGIIKKIDEARYARKFTPRRNRSKWSALNKQRTEKMIRQHKMTEAGMAKIKAAKESGLWDKDPRPMISFDVPLELARALARNKKARVNFEKLAPTYRKHYIGWIAVAKRPETKKRRIAESITLLEQGRKLGLK